MSFNQKLFVGAAGALIVGVLNAEPSLKGVEHLGFRWVVGFATPLAVASAFIGMSEQLEDLNKRLHQSEQKILNLDRNLQILRSRLDERFYHVDQSQMNVLVNQAECYMRLRSFTGIRPMSISDSESESESD